TKKRVIHLHCHKPNKHKELYQFFHITCKLGLEKNLLKTTLWKWLFTDMLRKTLGTSSKRLNSMSDKALWRTLVPRIAFNILEQIQAKRKIAVLGYIKDPPGQDGSIYRDLGKHILHITDLLYFIGDDNFSYLKAGATESGRDQSLLFHVGNNVTKSIELLKPGIMHGDMILIKGNGQQKLRRITLALS
ncbi:MAG: hypothetical protein NUV86_03205, partial [Candidatus Scalindua sp.]|nr:hypothetical protein [Candidatus Scalindua sp.]